MKRASEIVWQMTDLKIIGTDKRLSEWFATENSNWVSLEYSLIYDVSDMLMVNIADSHLTTTINLLQ